MATDRVEITITQSNSFAVGEAVYNDGTIWQLAKADDIGTLGVGVVSAATGSNFTVALTGSISGFAASTFTEGQYYFVSSATEGELTNVEPMISNPVALAVSDTEIFVLPYRPSLKTGENIVPSFHAHLNGSDQGSITTASYVKVNFSTTDFDTTGDFDSANYRYKPSVAGKYLFNAHVYYATSFSSQDQWAQVIFQKTNSGGSVRKDVNTHASCGSTQDVHGTSIWDMDGDEDYMEILVYHSLGSNQTIGGNITQSWFEGFRISA